MSGAFQREGQSRRAVCSDRRILTIHPVAAPVPKHGTRTAYARLLEPRFAASAIWPGGVPTVSFVPSLTVIHRSVL